MPFYEILFEQGGPVGIIIFAAFLLASALFFRRFILLHRATIDSESFLLGIKNNLKGGNSKKRIEAISICEETRGPVASMVRSILSRGTNDEAALRRAAEEASSIEIPRLQGNMHFIAAIGQLLPLLGLFGTIISLYSFFGELGESSNVLTMNIEKFSPYISKALVTTAMGIAGGMIIHLYNIILQGSCRTIVNDMEKTAMELISFIVEPADLADQMNDEALAEDKDNDK